MAKLRISKALPVHVVEPHNDAVPVLHRAIASKLLPYSGIPVLHLDSHPDLLIPIDLQADLVFQPQLLCDSLSIENWLLPLVYAGHLNHIIWVKPPWAHQIQTSERSFAVGKCSVSGKLRLTSKENYFLTEGLFCPADRLTNTQDVTLTVLEMVPQEWAELDPNRDPPHESVRESTTCPERQTEPANKLSKPENWVAHLQDIIQARPYVLDIDLDFFSTANPFKDLFTSEEEEALRRLYRYSTLTDFSDQNIAAFTSARERQLKQLEDIFSALEVKWFGEGTSCSETENFSLSDVIVRDKTDLSLLDSDQEADLIFLCENVIRQRGNREVTFMVLHYFGCTLDDTDLPHHISTPDQISALRVMLRNVLEQLPRPSVVTVARSSDDGYCPKDVVNQIQADVLKMLEDVYGSLQINIKYD